MLLLELDTTRKGQINENAIQQDFEANKNEKYKVNGIWNSAVYAKKSKAGYLPERYYLISWKNYSEEKNTKEPALALQYLQKLLSKFHHKNLNKLIATFPPINTTLPMAKLTIKLPTKWNQGRLVKSSAKCVKWGDKEGIYVSLVFNRARSRQMAKDLSFWRREHRKVYIGNLTICSSTFAENWIAIYSKQVLFFTTHLWFFLLYL